MMRRHYLALPAAGAVLIMILAAGCTLQIPKIPVTNSTLPVPTGTPAPVTPAATGSPVNPAPTSPGLPPTSLPVRTSIPPSQQSVILPSATDPYVISPPDLEERIHTLVNRERARAGVGALRADPALATVARAYSRDMAARRFFAHTDPEGHTLADRMDAASSPCRRGTAAYVIGENLFLNNLYASATYYSTHGTLYDWNSPAEIAETTVGGWMNSSGHRQNLLDPAFVREGIGVAIGADDHIYITEDFC